MKPKLFFFVTEDWFFVSHFLPMARAAVAAGFDVGVIARLSGAASAIEATGARVLPFDMRRGSLNPLQAGNAVRRLRGLLARERPDILHLISLKAILVGAAAAKLAGVPHRVHALTGRGFLGTGAHWRARAGETVIRRLLRGPLDGSAVRHLFENEDDARWMGFAAGNPRVRMLRGACSGRRASTSRWTRCAAPGRQVRRCRSRCSAVPTR